MLDEVLDTNQFFQKSEVIMPKEIIFRHSTDVNEIVKLKYEWTNKYIAMGSDISVTARQQLEEEYRLKVPDERTFEYLRDQVVKSIRRERGHRQDCSQSV